MILYFDASAIVAMIAKEPEATRFGEIVERNDGRISSPVAIWEAVRAIARVRGVDLDEARTLVSDFVRATDLTIVPINAETGEMAIDAHREYGKGVHAAELNMGDCFAYACTKQHDAAILFKGNDFAETDLTDATLG